MPELETSAGDGSVKFKSFLTAKEFPPITEETIRELDEVRDFMFRNGFIGEENGIGYGCVAQKRENGIIITRTGTGGLEKLTPEDYVWVSGYNIETNRTFWDLMGDSPSSETPTVATALGFFSSGAAALHGHNHDLWVAAKDLKIPATSEFAEYGTSQIAEEVLRLFRETDVLKTGIFVMGGHRDGFVAVGSSPMKAWRAMMDFAKRVGLML